LYEPIKTKEMSISLSIFLIIISLIAILNLFAIIEILKNEFRGTNDKLIWLVVIILLAPIGVLFYYFIGRKQLLGFEENELV